MSLAPSHAHPCSAIAVSTLTTDGVFGAATLLTLLAAIGDHAEDETARLVIRTALESAARALPAEMADLRRIVGGQ